MYLKQLEVKNKELEQQNKDLLEENLMLKRRLDCLGSETKTTNDTILDRTFEDKQKFTLEELPKLMSTEPDKITYTLIDNCLQEIGETAPERIDILKKAFRVILNNCLSPITQSFYTCFSRITFKEWDTKLKHKRWEKETKYYSDDLSLDPRKVALSTNLSEGLREALVKDGHIMMRRVRLIKHYIRKLVKLRNSFLSFLYT